MKKTILKITKALAFLWTVLFAVFWFDLDGKFLYYIWEPAMDRRYSRMERKDMTKTPYSMKDKVLAEEDE